MSVVSQHPSQVGVLLSAAALVCALAAPVVFYVKGIDALLNAPSTAATVLAVMVSVPTTLVVLFLAWVNGPGGG